MQVPAMAASRCPDGLGEAANGSSFRDAKVLRSSSAFPGLREHSVRGAINGPLSTERRQEVVGAQWAGAMAGDSDDGRRGDVPGGVPGSRGTACATQKGGTGREDMQAATPEVCAADAQSAGAKWAGAQCPAAAGMLAERAAAYGDQRDTTSAETWGKRAKSALHGQASNTAEQCAGAKCAGTPATQSGHRRKLEGGVAPPAKRQRTSSDSLGQSRRGTTELFTTGAAAAMQDAAEQFGAAVAAVYARRPQQIQQQFQMQQQSHQQQQQHGPRPPQPQPQPQSLRS